MGVGVGGGVHKKEYVALNGFLLKFSISPYFLAVKLQHPASIKAASLVQGYNEKEICLVIS